MLVRAGNLCWDAAMEFEVASRSVHSTVLSDGQADPQVCLMRAQCSHPLSSDHHWQLQRDRQVNSGNPKPKYQELGFTVRSLGCFSSLSFLPQGDDKFRCAFMDIAKRFMAEVQLSFFPNTCSGIEQLTRLCGAHLTLSNVASHAS